MEIREFVKTALTDIANGVQDAIAELETMQSVAVVNPMSLNAGTIPNGYYRDRPVQKVEMSIAVTASDETSKGGKVGLNVVAFSAELNASKTATANSSVSTITFSVPIALPFNPLKK